MNHGDELRWLAFDLKMWKGQPAYLELLDDGPGYIAIREAWFADSPPPDGPMQKVTLPNLPTSDKPDAMKLVERIRELEARLPEPRRAPTMSDGTGINEHVFVRGNHKNIGVEAPRGFLEAFGRPVFASTGSGRLELAKALTDPKNPLLARVIVNRLWKHHFGEGIVRSPDDFGLQGQLPTHPVLLDWLAAELVAPAPGKWSLKYMHRLMVLSTAYRQTSRATAEQAAKAITADSQNKLLHRQNVRRLEAEAIRDAILLVSGRLDRAMEGLRVAAFGEHQSDEADPSGGRSTGNGGAHLSRAPELLNTDVLRVRYHRSRQWPANGRTCCSASDTNNPFVLQQAELWGPRCAGILSTGGVRAYEAAFGRADEGRTRDANEFLADQSAVRAGPSDSVDQPRARINEHQGVHLRGLTVSPWASESFSLIAGDHQTLLRNQPHSSSRNYVRITPDMTFG